MKNGLRSTISVRMNSRNIKKMRRRQERHLIQPPNQRDPSPEDQNPRDLNPRDQLIRDPSKREMLLQNQKIKRIKEKPAPINRKARSDLHSNSILFQIHSYLALLCFSRVTNQRMKSWLFEIP